MEIVPNLTEVNRLNTIIERYRSARNKWYNRGLQYEMIVRNDVEGTGTHFTKQQISEIVEKNGIPLSVNISVAFIEQMQSFLTANKPSIRVIPTGRANKELSYVFEELLRASLRLNHFSPKLELAVGDMETVGNGYLFVTSNSFYNQNSFNVVLKALDWKQVYFSPSVTEFTFQDSEFVIIEVPSTKTKAQKNYQLTEEELRYATMAISNVSPVNNAFGYTVSNDAGDPMISIYEIFEKVQANLYLLKDGTKTFDRPENPESILSENPGIYVKRYLKIGNYLKPEFTSLMPIKLYPIAVYSHNFNRTPYSESLIHHIVDLQKVFNKVIVLTLENAQANSNGGVDAPVGSIQNKEQYMKDRATPGGIAEFDADPNLPNGGYPAQRIGQPLASAWYEFQGTLIKLIEYITGIYDLMQGNPQNAPQTASATNDLQNFGSQRPRMRARRIDASNEILGEIILQYFQAFAPEENVITYLADSDTMLEIVTNVPMDNNGQVNELSEQKGNIIRDMTGKTVRAVLGDMRAGEYRVAFESSNDLPTVRKTIINSLQALLPSMANDSLRVAIIQSIMELLDYPEADKILKNVNVINQLQQQANELASQVENLDAELQKAKQVEEKLEKALILKDFEVEVEKNKLRAEQSVKELDADTKQYKQEQKQKQTKLEAV